jgi:hypothetical protein
MPQPVKAAAVYYMRFIVHDWSTPKNIEILKNVRAAAGPNSKLVIWDMLVPNACRSTDPETGALLLPPGLDWTTAVDIQVCILLFSMLGRLMSHQFFFLDDEPAQCTREDVARVH